jgi:hypothetical protein
MATDRSCDVWVRGYLVADAAPKMYREGAGEERHMGKRCRSTLVEVVPGTWVDEGTILPTAIREALIRASGPWGGNVLTFDVETGTDTAQEGGAGAYALHGIPPKERFRLATNGRLTREALDKPIERGLFYWPERVGASEWVCLQQHASATGSRLMTVQQFVNDVFYPWAYWQGALVVGHNLPFDLSRLAVDWQAGRWKDGNRWASGFTLHLCDCERPTNRNGKPLPCFDHQPIRIRHISRRVNFIQFQHNRVPSKMKDGRRAPPRSLHEDGYFVDTLTLGCGLREPRKGASQEGLSDVFGTSYQKPPHDFKGPITPELLTYLQADVSATFRLYCAERDEYAQHKLGWPITKLYSQASLTKAYLAEAGVHSSAHSGRNHLPADLLGYGMVSFFGGRSEVSYRLRPFECSYLDYRAQYPAVIALLGLQRFLLAKRIKVERGISTALRVRTWLADPHLLDRLFDPASWKRLCVLCRMRPDGDRLPVRGKFQPGMAAPSIANCYLTSGEEHWYTLADLAASVIRTGRLPEIVDAIELVPEGEIPTKPVALFGDERFVVDLSQDDLAVRLVELRTDAKGKLPQLELDDPDRARLEAVIGTAKIVANALYGVLVEVNVQEPTVKPRKATLYATEQQEIRTTLTETPGRYYAGPLGAFVTAGGRLLLALAEQLGIELGERLGIPGGIRHAMCDTDSITLIRPAGMDRHLFWQIDTEIRRRLQQLSPYRDGEDFLKLEKENFALLPAGSLDQPRREPLYALCISPKRYLLYNRPPDGRFITRKFSMSGVGAFDDPGMADRDDGMDAAAEDDALDDLARVLVHYRSPAHIPDPVQDVAKLGGGKGRRWMYDGWYQAIERAERDIESDWEMRLDRPELALPAFRQVTITTPALLKQYRHVPGIRPFNFITQPASFSNRIVRQRTGTQAALRQLDEAQRELRETEAVWYEVRQALLEHGGIRPDSLREDYRSVPLGVRRKKGEPVDVMASIFGFDSVDGFVDHLASVYRAVKAAGRLVEQRLRELSAEKEGDLTDVPLYAPYCRTARDLLGKVRRSDTHEVIDPDVRLVTMSELSRDYFRHRNNTAADPHAIGDCGVLQVHARSVVVHGKESHPIRSDGTDVEGGREERTHVYGTLNLSVRMRRFPRAFWYDQLCPQRISRRQVDYLYDGTCRPSELDVTNRQGKPPRPRKGTRELIAQALARVEATPPPSWEDTVRRMRVLAASELHKATDISKRTLQRYLRGECRARGKRLAALLAGLQKLEAERAMQAESHLQESAKVSHEEDEIRVSQAASN